MKLIFRIVLFVSLAAGAGASERLIQVPIQSLHPTQPCLGYLEVQSKVRKIQKMSRSDFERALKENALPVVRGPFRQLWAYDHQHWARAVQLAGGKKVFVHVTDDWSSLNPDDFQKKLIATGKVFLSRKGVPITFSELPSRISEMDDDIYRSLAGHVRDLNGFCKTPILFAEFFWADYFRPLVSAEDVTHNFDEVSEELANVAHESEASSLPGYISRGSTCSSAVNN